MLGGQLSHDLGTFHTDVENSFRMATSAPARGRRVGCRGLESGISDPEIVVRLREAGFERGFLMGEAFYETAIRGALAGSSPGKKARPRASKVCSCVRQHPAPSNGCQ